MNVPYEMTSMNAKTYMNGLITDGRYLFQNIIVVWIFMSLLNEVKGTIYKTIMFKSSSQALFISYIFYQEKYAFVYLHNWYDKLQNITIFCNRLFCYVK